MALSNLISAAVASAVASSVTRDLTGLGGGGGGWDLSSLNPVPIQSNANSNQLVSTVNGLWFRPDGLMVFVIGSTNAKLYSQTLSSPFDLDTIPSGVGGYVPSAYAPASTGQGGLWMPEDGSSVWYGVVLGSQVEEIALPTPWDLTSPVGLGQERTLTVPQGANDVWLSEDGTQLIRMASRDAEATALVQYSMSTPFLLSSATEVAQIDVSSFLTSGVSENVYGMFVKDTQIFLMSATEAKIYELEWDQSDISGATKTTEATFNKRANGSIGMWMNENWVMILNQEGSSEYIDKYEWNA